MSHLNSNYPNIIFSLLKTFDKDLKHFPEFHWTLLEPLFYKGLTMATAMPTTATAMPTAKATANKIVSMPTAMSTVRKFQGSLFQCILFSLQGKSCEIREEINEKQKMIQELSALKKTLKTIPYRMTKSELEEIISDLITLSTKKHEYMSCFGIIHLNLYQTVLYSHYYKKNICLFSPLQKIWLDFVIDDSYPCLYLEFKKGSLFEIVLDAPAPDLSTFIKAESPVSLLKSISHYKIAELKSIHQQRVGTTIPEKTKKQELYQIIGGNQVFYP